MSEPSPPLPATLPPAHDGAARAPRPDAPTATSGLHTGDLTIAQLVELLLLDQREKWHSGKRVCAEEYLAQHPGIRAEPEYALDLVYSEFLLREEMGEQPALEEYAQRFPDHAEALRVQVELHRAMPPDRASGLDTDAGDYDLQPTVPGYGILGKLVLGPIGVVYLA